MSGERETSTSPILAVVGHPNKGKSSLVATLAEDDSVAISATPGTTLRARSYPLRVDGELESTPLRWNAGVLYLMDQLDYENDVVAQAPRESLVQVYDQKTWSFGAFAGFEWDIFDDFTFEGGFR